MARSKLLVLSGRVARLAYFNLSIASVASRLRRALAV